MPASSGKACPPASHKPAETPNESCDVAHNVTCYITCKVPTDVILNGGIAAVRDRTSAKSFDVVNGNTTIAQTAMLNGEGTA